ncbi:MAG: hypothetical protein IPF92_02165 [Myxococcales bacterium]|nr:hypothetical protein [Myxococcales bacterium]MBL0193933.1 hypothetical protein [Myxococcales bacterium]
MRAGHGLAALVGVSVWALGCSSEPAPSASPGGSATPVVSGEPEPVDAAAPSVDAAPPPNGTPGCGAVVVSGLREGLALTVAGTPRTYTLWLPERYDPRRAHRLVVGLHSGGRTGASARPYLDLEGRSEGAVFVYPDAIRGNWDLNTPYAQNPDFAFFDALMRELSDTLCLDATRFFAVGTSAGAYFANQLACGRGGVLRAIAAHAGGGPFQTPGDYDAAGHLICPTPPVAAAIFHGLADTSVSPTEGEKAVRHWSFWNGCDAARQPAAPTPCEGPKGCQRPVLVCTVPGQGHAVWGPGRQATWDFFAQF